MISEYHSKKLKVLSFFLIVLVLYIHSYYLEGEKYYYASIIQNVIDKGLCSVAVPMFFFISGFLFFLHVSDVGDVFVKQQKRVKSLLIPYILWNIVFCLWYVVLYLVPGASKYVNSDIIDSLIHKSLLDGVYVFLIEPIGFHLWFLRDLILFVILTPFIFVFFRCLKEKGLTLVFLMALISIYWYYLNGLFFFILGGYISTFSSIERFSILAKSSWWIVMPIYLLYSAFIPYQSFFFQTRIIGEMCGILTIWQLYDSIPAFQSLSKFSFIKYTFFIYCFHEPTFNIIKKINLTVLGEGDFQLSLLYLINPLLFLIIAVLVAVIFDEKYPKTYRLLSGYR